MPDDHDGGMPRVRFDWGRRGAQSAAARGDILVVIDTLRFSTAAATAIHHGALVYPSALDAASISALAERVGGQIASYRYTPGAQAPARFSLSPRSFLGIEPGVRVVLPSPNGSTCCQYGAQAAAIFVGALINAQAVAAAASQLLRSDVRLNATLLACGERWRVPDEEGALRFALEDYLGAGAMLSELPFAQTVEAQACAVTFQAMRDHIEEALWECESGQELRAKELGDDVRFASQLNIYNSTPTLRGERLEAFPAPAR
jgi:2-phosphosulfolactate phosphatase